MVPMGLQGFFPIGYDPAKEQLRDRGGGSWRRMLVDLLQVAFCFRQRLMVATLYPNNILSLSVDTRAQSAVPSPISELAGGCIGKPDCS